MISSADLEIVEGCTVRPYNISKNLAGFGCEIMHVCFKPPKQRNGIYYYIKYDKNVTKVRKILDILKLYKEIKRFAPDVIYAHQVWNAIIAIPLKYLLRIPLVYDAHGSSVFENVTIPRIPFYRFILITKQEEIILKTSDKVIVVAYDLKKFFIDYFGISENKIELAKNGVDMNLLKPAKPAYMIKKELGISSEDKVVVFTCPRHTNFPANTIALKYFFSLIPKIENNIKNIRFVIVGGGPQFPPPSPNVIYTGFVDDLVSYLNIGDAFIASYPSSSMCGTGGSKNKIIQYFAFGKPIVSTEEGIRGFEDAKPDRDYSLGMNPDDFVEKLLRVLQDEKLSQKLGENARKFSLRYDWVKISNQVMNVLDQVVQKR